MGESRTAVASVPICQSTCVSRYAGARAQIHTPEAYSYIVFNGISRKWKATDLHAGHLRFSCKCAFNSLFLLLELRHRCSDQSQFQICCFESNTISNSRVFHELPPQIRLVETLFKPFCPNGYGNTTLCVGQSPDRPSVRSKSLILKATAARKLIKGALASLRLALMREMKIV